jgi:hypothetical protein
MRTRAKINLFVERCVGKQNKCRRNPDLISGKSNAVQWAKSAADFGGTKAKVFGEFEFREPFICERLIHCLPDRNGEALPPNE